MGRLEGGIGSAGARAFEVEGPNLKVGESKFFIDFSPKKKHAVHNAITSINNF